MLVFDMDYASQGKCIFTEDILFEFLYTKCYVFISWFFELDPGILSILKKLTPEDWLVGAVFYAMAEPAFI